MMLTRRRLLVGRRFVPVVLSIATILSACREKPPLGQFGRYYAQVEHLVTRGGDTIPIDRIQVTEPGGASIVLEFEPRFEVGDPSSSIREMRRLWPYFVPYMYAHHVAQASLVTTTFRHVGVLHPTVISSSVMLEATQHSDGRWFIGRDSVPLPTADATSHPGIIGLDGRSLQFDFPPTGRHRCEVIQGSPVICAP